MTSKNKPGDTEWYQCNVTGGDTVGELHLDVLLWDNVKASINFWLEDIATPKLKLQEESEFALYRFLKENVHHRQGVVYLRERPERFTYTGKLFIDGKNVSDMIVRKKIATRWVTEEIAPSDRSMWRKRK